MTGSPLWPWVGVPLLIFLARTVDVSLGTVRIILVARGHRGIAPLIGFVEILIWLLALSQVIQHLDRSLNFVAYAGGYAAGTYTGMWLEQRLALGLVAVRVIARSDARELIEALRDADLGVTSVSARGVRDRVRLLFTVIPRKDVDRVLELVRRHQPRAFISISDVRSAEEGHLPDGRSGSLRFWERRKSK